MVDANSATLLAMLRSETARRLLSNDDRATAWLGRPLRHIELQTTDHAHLLDECITQKSRPLPRYASALAAHQHHSAAFGGYTSARRIHDLCSKTRCGMVWGMLESGIGRATTCALDAANFSAGDVTASNAIGRRHHRPEVTVRSGEHRGSALRHRVERGRRWSALTRNSRSETVTSGRYVFVQ